MASITALHPSQHQVPSVPAGQEAHSSLPAVGVSTSDNVPRGQVQATLNFFVPPADGSQPFNYVEKPPEGEPQRNFPDQDVDVTVRDIRGHESDYTLDKNAVKAVKGYPHNPSINWDDDESVKREYYPQVERVLKDHTGCSRVFLFDHTIRKAHGNRQPVNRAHIDQTPLSTKMRVEHHLPEEAEKLLQGRYRIINVWRPLNGKVESNPLAFANSPSVQDDDTIPIEHRYPHRTGYTAGVKHNPNHEWLYWSGVDNDERLLLQCADSANWANRLPHSAFKDPRSSEKSKDRESIEVRALVFG